MQIREIIFGLPNTPQPENRLGNVVRIENVKGSHPIFHIQLDSDEELSVSLDAVQRFARGVENVGNRVWIDDSNMPVFTTLEVHTRRPQ